MFSLTITYDLLFLFIGVFFYSHQERLGQIGEAANREGEPRWLET